MDNTDAVISFSKTCSYLSSSMLLFYCFVPYFSL